MLEESDRPPRLISIQQNKAYLSSGSKDKLAKLLTDLLKLTPRRNEVSDKFQNSNSLKNTQKPHVCIYYHLFETIFVKHQRFSFILVDDYASLVSRARCHRRGVFPYL